MPASPPMLLLIDHAPEVVLGAASLVGLALWGTAFHRQMRRHLALRDAPRPRPEDEPTPTTEEVTRAMDGLRFPATRDILLAHVRTSPARDAVVRAFEGLRGERFDDARDVRAALERA